MQYIGPHHLPSATIKLGIIMKRKEMKCNEIQTTSCLSS